MNDKKRQEVINLLTQAVRLLTEETAETGTACEAPAVKLEDVRALLVKLSRAGRGAEVQELIRKHGADKLSTLDPKEFAPLKKEAEELLHG